MLLVTGLCEGWGGVEMVEAGVQGCWAAKGHGG